MKRSRYVNVRTIPALLGALLFVAAAAGCGPNSGPGGKAPAPTKGPSRAATAPAPKAAVEAPSRAAEGSAAQGSTAQAPAAQPAKAESGEVLARIQTSMGLMVARLYADKTPNTVANFVHLATKGYYNGLIFHRVIPNFMIQGGCPEGTGRGGPGWRIADEFVPGVGHSGAGILSMANAGPNTNGSQFFITLKACEWLDGKHTVFGELVEGMEVLKEIGGVRTGRADRPVEPVVIESVTILRNGEPLTEVQPKPKTL